MQEIVKCAFSPILFRSKTRRKGKKISLNFGVIWVYVYIIRIWIMIYSFGMICSSLITLRMQTLTTEERWHSTWFASIRLSQLIKEPVYANTPIDLQPAVLFVIIFFSPFSFLWSFGFLFFFSSLHFCYLSVALMFSLAWPLLVDGGEENPFRLSALP